MLICALSSSAFCFSEFFSFSAELSCAFVASSPAVAPRSNYASALPNFSAARRSFRVACVAVVCSALSSCFRRYRSSSLCTTFTSVRAVSKSVIASCTRISFSS